VTYSLQFTERMIGTFAFAERDYRAGRDSGNSVMFRLTIGTDDVSAFIADPDHVAVPRGYVGCESLGGRLAVQDGTFDLFVDEGDHRRHMLYRLYFADSTGRPLTLAGYKDVRPGPLTQVWPETSTLYTRILNGHVPVTDGGASVTDGIVGSGILRIRPLDFAWQLTTFRVHGPTWAGRFRALSAFSQLFLAELWQVFDPIRGRTQRG
jgi:cholesterol oxidase